MGEPGPEGHERLVPLSHAAAAGRGGATPRSRDAAAAHGVGYPHDRGGIRAPGRRRSQQSQHDHRRFGQSEHRRREQRRLWGRPGRPDQHRWRADLGRVHDHQSGHGPKQRSRRRAAHEGQQPIDRDVANRGALRCLDLDHVGLHHGGPASRQHFHGRGQQRYAAQWAGHDLRMAGTGSDLQPDYRRRQQRGPVHRSGHAGDDAARHAARCEREGESGLRGVEHGGGNADRDLEPLEHSPVPIGLHSERDLRSSFARSGQDLLHPRTG